MKVIFNNCDESKEHLSIRVVVGRMTNRGIGLKTTSKNLVWVPQSLTTLVEMADGTHALMLPQWLYDQKIANADLL
jgi:hypothetical protein